MSSGLASWFAFPRVIVLAAVLAAVVATPAALQGGFDADDYVQLLILEERLHVDMGIHRYDLYNFMPGDPAVVAETKDRGPVPWFTHPELKGAFWRPLSALLIVGDHALFGRDPTGYKVHSALWYVLCVLAFGLVMRRVLPNAVGALALLSFTLLVGHREPVVWLAARYVLVTTTFGLLALWCHIRWREDGWRPGLYLSLGAYACCVLGGEAAIGNFAYLGAYELIAGRGSLRRRIGALVPAATLAIGWLWTYRSLGYGTYGCGAYINPLFEAGSYLQVMPPRLLFLIGAMYFGFPGHFWFIPQSEYPFLLQMGGLSLVVLAWLLFAAFRRADSRQARTVAWFTLGSTLTLFPQAAATLAPRSQTTPSIGACVVVGFLVHWGYQALTNRKAERPGIGVRLRWISCTILFLLHFVWNPVLWFLHNQGEGAFRAENQRIIDESGLASSDYDDRKVVTFVGSNSVVSMYYPFQRQFEGGTHPRAWWTLSYASGKHAVRRVDESTLEVEPLDGNLLRNPFDAFFRNARLHPFSPGDEVRIDGLHVQVLAVSDGAATRVRFTFDPPPDDPVYYFTDSRLQPVKIPPVGEAVTVE